MENEIKAWLYDILQSISEVEGYYNDRPRNFTDYLLDLKQTELLKGISKL